MFGFPWDTTVFLWILPGLVAIGMFFYVKQKNSEEEEN